MVRLFVRPKRPITIESRTKGRKTFLRPSYSQRKLSSHGNSGTNKESGEEIHGTPPRTSDVTLSTRNGCASTPSKEEECSEESEVNDSGMRDTLDEPSL